MGENVLYKVGNIKSVKSVVVISLFMIIFVSGCWILVLILLDINMGINFNVDVIVVIKIGFSLDVVLVKIVFLIVIFFFICWLIFFIIIMLFKMVILNSVMKLIEFGIDRYWLEKYKENMFLMMVSGILISINIVCFRELNVK